MKDEIQRLLKEGWSNKKICHEIGCSSATVSYHARKLGLEKAPRPSYDWTKVQAFYDQGHSMYECMEHFGFNKASWSKAVERKAVKPSDWRIPLEDLLTEHSKHKRGHIKKRLLTEGLLRNECYECGSPPNWRGKILTMVLDHINGIHNDHRLENLRMLCPNCNSQTDTFCGRNKPYKI